MQLQYMGFEQVKNVREYIFHGVAHGEQTKIFVVSADLDLFLKCHLNLQDGPILCLRALAAELAGLDPAVEPPLRHAIDERDIGSYLADPALRGGKKAAPRRTHAVGVGLFK